MELVKMAWQAGRESAGQNQEEAWRSFELGLATRMPYITPAQKALLEEIKSYRQKHGYSPTLREMADARGYSSIGSIQQMVDLLKEKGLVVWNKYEKRGIIPV